MTHGKIYTREQLDHAIDTALHIGDGELSKLYGRKDTLEMLIKVLKEQYVEVCIEIDAREMYREKIIDDYGVKENDYQ